MHKKNITHRDLKPSNILIDNAGRAIVIDFSHAHRCRTNSFILDDAIATYTHRAPEIFQYQKCLCKSYNEKIDIWAIGIMLVEMVIGESLYNFIDDGTEKSVAEFVETSDYMSKIEIIYHKNKKRFTWYKKYWNWIVKMLKYNPEERTSAEQIYKEIYQFAVCNNIDFIVPRNGNYDIYDSIIRNYAQYDETCEDKHLLELCMIKADYFKRMSYMTISLEHFKPLLKFFINKHEICVANMHYTVLALMIMIEAVVYDDLIDMSHLLSIHKNIDKIMLTDVMKYIISYYDKELFLYNIFNFYDNIDTICKRIDVVTNKIVEISGIVDEKNNGIVDDGINRQKITDKEINRLFAAVDIKNSNIDSKDNESIVSGNENDYNLIDNGLYDTNDDLSPASIDILCTKSDSHKYRKDKESGFYLDEFYRFGNYDSPQTD
jgi:hypothetical protein